ncbi:MAG: hypothetical protein PF450_10885, partial [Bacteroidales bacterium]|nr:hypothetical protein [Bacteroidales bacterium]
MIKRDKQPVASQIFETTSGEKLQLNHDGTRCISKPHYQEHKTDEGTIKIDIKARSIDEARRMVKDLQRRKYPQIDVDQFLNKISDNASYSTDLLKYNISFGGGLSGRSVVKTALAFAYDISIPPSDCECAMNYLLNEKGFPCFGYYYQEKDLVSSRPVGVPLHCVAISGNPESGLLIGYIEYFSVYRIVVCLSESYSGESLNNSYAIDPRTGDTLSLNVDCFLPVSELHAAYNYDRFSDQVMRSAFGKVLDEALKAANLKESE